MNQKNERLRRVVKAALFAAMLCVLSPLSIPAGDVPFSLLLAAVYRRVPDPVVCSCQHGLLSGCGNLRAARVFEFFRRYRPSDWTDGRIFVLVSAHGVGCGAVSEAVRKAERAEPVRRDDGGLFDFICLRHIVLCFPWQCRHRCGACGLCGAVYLV